MDLGSRCPFALLALISCALGIWNARAGESTYSITYDPDSVYALDTFVQSRLAREDLDRFNDSQAGLISCRNEDPASPVLRSKGQDVLRDVNRELVRACSAKIPVGTVKSVNSVKSFACAKNGQVPRRYTPVKYGLEKTSSGIKISLRSKFVTDSGVSWKMENEMKESLLKCVGDMKGFFARYGIELDYRVRIANHPVDKVRDMASGSEAPEHTILLKRGTGRSTVGQFYYGGQGSAAKCAEEARKNGADGSHCERARQRELCLMMTHETGHLFGLGDEYRARECPDREFPTQVREMRPGSLMAQEDHLEGWEHLELFPRHIAAILEPVCGSAKTLRDKSEKKLEELLSPPVSPEARDLLCDNIGSAQFLTESNSGRKDVTPYAWALKSDFNGMIALNCIKDFRDPILFADLKRMLKVGPNDPEARSFAVQMIQRKAQRKLWQQDQEFILKALQNPSADERGKGIAEILELANGESGAEFEKAREDLLIHSSPGVRAAAANHLCARLKTQGKAPSGELKKRILGMLDDQSDAVIPLAVECNLAFHSQSEMVARKTITIAEDSANSIMARRAAIKSLGGLKTLGREREEALLRIARVKTIGMDTESLPAIDALASLAGFESLSPESNALLISALSSSDEVIQADLVKALSKNPRLAEKLRLAAEKAGNKAAAERAGEALKRAERMKAAEAE